MPRHCSAGGCKSRDNRETRNVGITFHKLPKGESRRNLWIANSHRADSWVPQTDFVYFCSRHFTPENFELVGCSGIRRLKEDAFPTVFDSFTTAKCKRKGTQKKRDIPLREIAQMPTEPEIGEKECNNFRTYQSMLSSSQQTLWIILTSNQMNICSYDRPLHTDKCRTSDGLSEQRSVALVEEKNENILESSQRPSGPVQPSKQELSPPQPPSPMPRPLSPSNYMRRLPPPPGFYLSKEHSYAQLCPLMWRRRYHEAIDCLEKALRQLHAARRRENRLRNTVLRLRDKRLKQVLFVSQDGCKNNGSLAPGEENRLGKVSFNHEENVTGASSEDIEVFDSRFVDQIEFEAHFLSDTNNWSEEEKGYCFFCGRGQVHAGKNALPVLHKDSLDIQRSVETGTSSTSKNVKDKQVVSLERILWKGVKKSDSDKTDTKVLQNQSLQHVIPAGESLTDTHGQSLQFLGRQQKPLPSDMCERQTKNEHQLDQQQQLFRIQDGAEGQLILVPVPVEDGSRGILKMDGVTNEAQTILVSDGDLEGEMRHMAESSTGLSRVETAFHGKQTNQRPVINPISVDVREKLKEHLEGFHLQLSTEFLN